MSVNDRKSRPTPFRTLGSEIRRYYRENGEIISMGWANIIPRPETTESYKVLRYATETR